MLWIEAHSLLGSMPEEAIRDTRPPFGIAEPLEFCAFLRCFSGKREKDQVSIGSGWHASPTRTAFRSRVPRTGAALLVGRERRYRPRRGRRAGGREERLAPHARRVGAAGGLDGGL
jgi:hypothetical protein